MELTGRREKNIYVVVPLAKFWMFALVSGTDTTPIKEIKYLKISVAEPHAKFRFYLQLRRLRWIA